MSNVKVRSLIGTIPELVGASFHSQSIELSRVIASTFEFSDGMKKELNNVPPHYIERVRDFYQKKMYEVFEKGFEAGPGIEKNFDFTKYDAELATKCHTPIEYINFIKDEFLKEVGDYLKSVVNMDGIQIQIGMDVDAIYKAGIEEYLKGPREAALKAGPVQPVEPVAPPPPPEAPPAAEAPPADAPPASPAESEVDPLAVISKAIEAHKLVSASISKEEIQSKFEEYTKLLNNPMAEEVLRYVLGLQPKVVSAPPTVTADAKEIVKDRGDEKETAVESGEFNEDPDIMPIEAKVGPYVIPHLRNRILDVIPAMKMDDDEEQHMLVDCVSSSMSKKGYDVAAGEIANALDIVEAIDESTYDEVNIAAEVLAADLTQAVGLPGQFQFVDCDDNYCLVFAFDKKSIPQMKPIASTIEVTARKRKDNKGIAEIDIDTPMGALDKKNQEELSFLLGCGMKPGSIAFTKAAKLSDFKGSAPTFHKYLSDKIKSALSGDITMKALKEVCNSNMSELAEKIYGADGRKYLEIHANQKVKV